MKIRKMFVVVAPRSRAFPPFLQQCSVHQRAPTTANSGQREPLKALLRFVGLQGINATALDKLRRLPTAGAERAFATNPSMAHRTRGTAAPIVHHFFAVSTRSAHRHPQRAIMTNAASRAERRATRRLGSSSALLTHAIHTRVSGSTRNALALLLVGLFAVLATNTHARHTNIPDTARRTETAIG